MDYEQKRMGTQAAAQCSVGGIIGREEPIRDRGQIPQSFERLNRHMMLLSEITSMLEDRLIPVIDQNATNRPQQLNGAPVPPAPPVCSMAVAIREQSNTLEGLVTRLQIIHNNIQL